MALGTRGHIRNIKSGPTVVVLELTRLSLRWHGVCELIGALKLPGAANDFTAIWIFQRYFYPGRRR